MNKTILSLCFVICSIFVQAQQNSLELLEKTSTLVEQSTLLKHFTNYTLLNINQSYDYGESNQIKIQLSNNQIIQLDLDHSQQETNTFPVFVDGIARESISRDNIVQSFKKETDNGYIKAVVNDNKLYSLSYKNDEGIYYIERLQKFIPNSNENLYILYADGDSVITDSACPVSNTEEYINQLESRIHSYVENQEMANECINIKLAIGCPSNMFSHYGTASNVESEITTIINNIASNFDTDFNKRIDFEITSINVATSSSSSLDTDLGTLTDYIDTLNAFKDWSNNGNLTSQDYDIGILFTRTDFDGTPVGGAFTDALCTNPQNRYIVIQDVYSGGLTKNQVSHEIGHSFGSVHTSSGIMTASVSTSTSWDSSSIAIINAKEQASDCNFGTYALDGTPTAQFVLAEKACKDEIIILNGDDSRNTTTWNWTFSEGSPQSSQETTTSFGTAGNKDVSLVVQNNYAQCNNTSTAITRSIEVLDLVAPQSASCSTNYDSNQGMNNELQVGIVNVSFGSIDNNSEGVFVNQLVLENHTCSETTVEDEGSTVTLSVTKGTSNFNIFTKAWLDYNNDGNFTADELILDNDSSDLTVSENIILTNTNTILETLLRLRVITDLNPISNACVKPTFGQVEDYGVIIQNPLSVDEFDITDVIHLTKNPFSDEATVFIPTSAQFESVKISLYDTSGKWHETQTFLPNNNHYTIQTKALSLGMYYIAIEANGKTIKVIKGIKV